ncbi:MAG: ANTAR domain-containing protein [Eubacteriales bacterium]|nr:ANTAR domain-containing protein [Eubacteriales bacterium]
MERKTPKLRTEREQRLIDRAKQLLMEQKHLSEEAAHRYMQKCSMDSGNNLVETAEMVFVLMRI